MAHPSADGRPVTIAVPTADRRTAFDFYVGLGFQPFGDTAEDGIPEPLQFTLNAGVRLMFIPTGGFGWVTGNRPAAAQGQAEYLLVHTVDAERDVVDLLDRARAGGGDVVMEAAGQPWGFSGVFADPDGHLWQVRAGRFRGLTTAAVVRAESAR